MLYSAVLCLSFIFLYSLLSGARENFPIIIVLSLVTIFTGRVFSGYCRGSFLAERLGNNDTEHENKGAGKVHRMIPSGEMKTLRL